ncbi:uncharacterized protein K460DRAFT_272527 [Cucurbitaria berberidis CBS 394.84]|uniref:Uncharacterized protein n=1 Tax=Cucurbitaria berberidis CBS 394.84 TaxID=1168544 RepID=A0A9P4GRA1_9PLEO|nr:uncharacterized protein K460DRAFT_272527 [Cucurbitaria berberidis CBS 394.84]KAF1850352.1 hypothetical protein K460DRAFT_272527 [Cucurbitaria berberidis CBS 394.84]
MTLQLCIRSTRERQPDPKGNTRSILRLSEVPDSPASVGAICEAVELDGRPCKTTLPPSACDPWCSAHHKEWVELNMRWSKVHTEAEQLAVTGVSIAKQKVSKLRLSVDLRRQIRDRFYPHGGDLQDYLKWLGKLENDVRQLADMLLMQNLNRGPTPETPGVHTGTPHPDKIDSGEKIMILQSPLDPRIPITSLRGIMPDDGTILTLKHFYLELCADIIRRLYYIAPALNDSPVRYGSPNRNNQCTPDHGTDIIRAWFRIMVLNDSEATTLQHATRSRGINDFLMGCQASQLEMYCDFFEKAWRPHAVQYLRVAICAQTLTDSDIKTIQLLGGTIPSTIEGLQMTKACWDILYRWFPTLLTPWTIAGICSNFEDYTTICKLLMLRLYNDDWYDPKSVLGDCATGVYMGFIPISKGDFSANAGLKQEGEFWVERQSRNYLCGQMAIGQPFTQVFLDELQRRTATLYLVVYEGTHADATVHPTEPDLFISRHRSSLSLDELDKEDFTTTLTLEDVKNQLRMRKTSMYDPIVVDSWQFIIIDREPGLPFQLIDIVQDTLLMLAGDPSPRQISKRVIREIIPPSVQESFLEDIQIESSFDLRYPPPMEVQYEGNRYRCYDPDPVVLATYQNKMVSQRRSRDDNRFIRRVIEDMERCGIISIAPEHEDSQIRPIIVQGSDGAPDLYFSYEPSDPTVEDERTPILPLPKATCLLDFAKSYKQKYPNAIMAKGTIQTHYCAWPMPAIKSLGRGGLSFQTWEGHVYRWNAMPFDRLDSANAWQYYIQHYVNSKFPFVMIYLNTFVICATNKEDADDNSEIILDEMEDRGWRAFLPLTHSWTTDIDELKLETLFSGVRPA